MEQRGVICACVSKYRSETYTNYILLYICELFGVCYGAVQCTMYMGVAHFQTVLWIYYL